MSAKDEDYDRDAGLASLTDEERAALAEDDEDDEAVKAEIESDAEDEDDDDEAEEAEESVAADPPKAQEVAAPADEESAPADEEAEEAPVVYQAALPADYDERVKVIADAEVELARKFEDGEIEAQEYVRETRRITAERGELDRIRVKAEMAAEMSQQAALHQWQQQVAKFMREAKKADGIDYRTDEAMGIELDTMVKALANNPAHNDKPSAWFLEQAHKAIKAIHGIGGKPAAPSAKPGNATSRKPPIDKAPKTLAQVPGGEGPGDVGDEFANLDNLDGDAYESALAKLSPAQRERYLASA